MDSQLGGKSTVSRAQGQKALLATPLTGTASAKHNQQVKKKASCFPAITSYA
jgi:hypothetical protein